MLCFSVDPCIMHKSLPRLIVDALSGYPEITAYRVNTDGIWGPWVDNTDDAASATIGEAPLWGTLGGSAPRLLGIVFQQNAMEPMRLSVTSHAVVELQRSLSATHVILRHEGAWFRL